MPLIRATFKVYRPCVDGYMQESEVIEKDIPPITVSTSVAEEIAKIMRTMPNTTELTVVIHSNDMYEEMVEL